jgi:hypothetical protein
MLPKLPKVKNPKLPRLPKVKKPTTQEGHAQVVRWLKKYDGGRETPTTVRTA